MNEHTQPLTQRPVTRAGPLSLLGAGREAFRTVPGLRGLLLKGFLLLYGLFLLLGAGMMALVYRYVVRPLSQGLAATDVSGNFFLDLLYPILAGLLWLGQALLLAATLLLAFVLSLSLMTVWFEDLAARVTAHARGGTSQTQSFSLSMWIATIGRAIRDNAVLFVLAVLSLVIGFVPLIGPFLAFALASFVMGWEVREPYLAVRAGQGDDLTRLRKGLTVWTLRAGTLAVLLAMIPWIGWMLLPVLLIYQVAGVAWLSEQRQNP